MLSLLLSAILVLPPLPPLAIPGALAAQDEEQQELPDKRPEIKELLDQLKEHIKGRGDEDPDAIQVIDRLTQEFPKSGPRDRAAIVAGISKCFDVRRRDTDEGLPENRLFLTSAVALRAMGPESVKVLIKALGNKKLNSDLVLQRELILSLGKTKDPEGLKPLLRCLDHHEYSIVAAGAEALGEFDGAPLELRKSVFSDLLKTLMSAKGQMDSDINDLLARERYEVIAAPLITSLGRLSGQDIRQPEEWQHWWNKNKKGNWDEREAG